MFIATEPWWLTEAGRGRRLQDRVVVVTGGGAGSAWRRPAGWRWRAPVVIGDLDPATGRRRRPRSAACSSPSTWPTAPRSRPCSMRRPTPTARSTWPSTTPASPRPRTTRCSSPTSTCGAACRRSTSPPGLPVLQARHSPHAAGRQGSIINTASFVAVMGAMHLAGVPRRRAAVLAMSRELGVQFAPRGHPGQRPVLEPGRHAAAAELFAKDPERAARRLVHVPMGGSPSPTRSRRRWRSWPATASFVTASTFLVDGGTSRRRLRHAPVTPARGPSRPGLTTEDEVAPTVRSPVGEEQAVRRARGRSDRRSSTRRRWYSHGGRRGRRRRLQHLGRALRRGAKTISVPLIDAGGRVARVPGRRDAHAGGDDVDAGCPSWRTRRSGRCAGRHREGCGHPGRRAVACWRSSCRRPRPRSRRRCSAG